MPRIGAVAKILKNQQRQANPNRPKVAIGYARFSDSNKVGMYFDSVESQEIYIKDYVKQHPNITLEKVYKDPGISGKDTNRPEYQSMLNRIRKGGVDLVIAFKLDRVSRDEDDFRELERIVEMYNAELYYTNGTNFDKTAEGAHLKRMTISNAVFEREMASQRVSEKYISGLSRGIMYGGMCPLGYITLDKPGEVAIDKNAAPVIKRIFELALKGSRPTEIAHIAESEFGLLPSRKLKNGTYTKGVAFSESRIRNILVNPFYAGYVYNTLENPYSIDVKYKLYDGKHEALITKEDWHKVMNFLRANKRDPKHKYPEIRGEKFLLKKYLRCECGRFMTVASAGKESKSGEPYRYYACTRKKQFREKCDCQTHIPLRIIEPIIFASLGYFLRDEVRSTSIKVDDEYNKEVSEKLSLLKKKNKALQLELTAKLDAYAKFEGSEAIRQNLEKQVRDLGDKIETNNKDIIRFSEELKILNSQSDVSRTRINRAFDDLLDLQSNISDDEKKEILSAVVEKIVLRCIRKVGAFQRDLAFRIFPKPEYVDKIPVVEIEFTMNTHSLRCAWKIEKPFELCSENKSNVKQRKAKKRHWLHDVMKDKERWEASGEKMREFCRNREIPHSMFYRKVHLLKTLSDEAISFILEIKEKEISELFTFRVLFSISQLARKKQLQELNWMKKTVLKKK